ncbi:DUF4012 domain-containing protein [Rhodococcus qingshengii]|jgi:hypothetical protein|uniref:DUF4012 domain-containing protein n=1 Tax=Rhodococcus TaxID=1827 RepID=UPI0002B7D82B|nr:MULTISPECIES: DUF4012 domain-containing protein [Rhodococcus]AUS32646.1 DUF4012 domain-containing protein [Rhodococcus qingshengii]EME19011.1 hypothetical protein G418_18210 [Rhodococcus qingshengii BKS 20-40]MCC4304910.1 DUF4012 domain-containing protein [Rhodococcus sp. 3-2]MDI9945777.1 DUF4012 domain-containing protein [Rhodococcus sp. IEGM 1302]MDJ0487339.1 DUF4012 domain-containing protein [Rhodococcus qingshengii]
MNNDTVGPKSDDDSGAEPSGSNTIPPRGPERETKGAAAFLRSRRTAVAITATTLVVGGFVAWLGYTAYEAKDNLEAARDHAQSAKSALLAGDTGVAESAAAEADREASAAYDNTHSLPWNITAAIPVIGSPFESTRQMTEVVQGLTRDVLGPAVTTGTSLAPTELVQPGGRLALAPLREAEPKLAETAIAAELLSSQAQEVPESKYLGRVNDARAELQSQTSELATLLTNTATAARIAPAMLGTDGPRNYFIGFQTNAEARGTGGLLGGYGIVRVDNGAARVDTLSPNSELTLDNQPIDLGPDFNQLYGNSRPTTDFRNSNLSSHFPYAAQIWQSLWSQESGGELVDGAIATDPIALSYLLEAVGPVEMPDGESVTADNVVELTESTAYARFPSDNKARKQYLQTIAARVVAKMTGNIKSPSALLEALGRGVSEGRIAVWSSHPDEQSVLADTVLGHTIPDDAAPYAGVVINNQAGNKLDYYLTREIDYTAQTCTGDTRKTTVTVRLTNNAPDADLTEYVSGIVDNPGRLPNGTNVAAVTLLATAGAKLDAVSVGGQISFAVNGTEQGHPAYMTRAVIPQGQTVELKFDLTEPTAEGEARVPVQPLVDDPKITVDVPSC